MVNNALNPESTPSSAASTSTSRSKETRLSVSPAESEDDPYSSTQVVINAVIQDENSSRANDAGDLRRVEETGVIPQHILADDTSSTPLEMQLGMDYAAPVNVGKSSYEKRIS